MNRATNRPMNRAILCGATMIMLAAASISLQTWIEVPLAIDYDRGFLANPDRAFWYDVYRLQPNKSKISVLELQTHKRTTCSLRQIQSEFNNTADGNYIRLSVSGDIQTLMNMDPATRQPIRETRLPVRFDGELINQRFMVTQRAGTMYVCDVLSDDPAKLRSLPLSDWHALAKTNFHAVDGTNLVVEVSAKAVATPTVSLATVPSNPPPRTLAVNVYRIDADDVTKVASWIAGDSQSPVIRHDNMLLSLSPDGLKLEGRELQNFAVVRNDSLSPELVDGLPQSVRNWETCQFYDLNSRSTKLYRIDTLEPLRQVDGLTIEYRNQELSVSQSPYRILRGADAAIQSRTVRLAVYDLSRDTIVFDRYFYGYPVAELLSGERLAVLTPACGVTLNIYDLKTGQCLETLRPFAWLLPWLALWSIAAAFAAFGWVYYSAQAGLSLLTSVLLLGACFVPVQLTPITQLGSTVPQGRLPVAYSIAVMLISAPAAFVWIGFSGVQNRTMRWTYQLLILSCVAMGLVTLELHNSFPQKWMLTGALIIAVVATVTSWCGLMVLRFRGYRASWLGSPAHGSPLREKSNPNLWHLFALSGASALFVVSLAPFRTIPMARHNSILGAAAETMIVAFPYLFIFVLLKMSDRWFARWTFLAMLAAALLVIDSLGAFIFPHFFILSVILPYARAFLMSLVFTFLWLWAFRLRGCRLARTPIAAQS